MLYNGISVVSDGYATTGMHKETFHMFKCWCVATFQTTFPYCFAELNAQETVYHYVLQYKYATVMATVEVTIRMALFDPFTALPEELLSALCLYRNAKHCEIWIF